MDRNDRQAIEALFDKLATVERQSPPRDAESEAFMRDKIARQPSASLLHGADHRRSGAGVGGCGSAVG